jgi:F-type H+-transporting ATPase subunit c
MNVPFLGLAYIGVFLGAALCLIGGAYGISKLSSAALEGVARQPEAQKDIIKTMFIGGAIAEGVAIIGIGVCFAFNFIFHS